MTYMYMLLTLSRTFKQVNVPLIRNWLIGPAPYIYVRIIVGVLSASQEFAQSWS